MRFSISALLCFCSFIMYSIIAVIGDVIPKAIFAYLIANKVSFAEDQFLLHFSFIKTVFLCFTVGFGILAILFAFLEPPKKAKND